MKKIKSYVCILCIGIISSLSISYNSYANEDKYLFKDASFLNIIKTYNEDSIVNLNNKENYYLTDEKVYGIILDKGSLYLNNVKAKGIATSYISRDEIYEHCIDDIEKKEKVIDLTPKTVGEIKVQYDKNEEKTVILKGKYFPKIVVNSDVIIKSDETTKISEIIVVGGEEGEKVILDGDIRKVTVNKNVNLILGSNAKIGEIVLEHSSKVRVIEGASVGKLIISSKIDDEFELSGNIGEDVEVKSKAIINIIEGTKGKISLMSYGRRSEINIPQKSDVKIEKLY